MISRYTLLPELFLRTPLLSFEAYRRTTPEQLLASPHFRQALYLASPEFYRVLKAKGFNAASLKARELLSVKKYHNRMNYRPTPFGLFSAFTLTRWGEEGAIQLPDEAGAGLHLLPDMQVSMTLAQLLSPPPAQDRFALNPTLYQLGKEFRFIRTESEPGHTRLRFSLQSLEASSLTKALCRFLKAGPASAEQILALLRARTGCTAEEALSYLEFLSEAQVICSLRGMNISGADHLLRQPSPLQADFRALSKHNTPVPTAELENWEAKVRAFFQQKKSIAPDKYFYANTEKKALRGNLSFRWQRPLGQAIDALQRLAPAGSPQMLTQFSLEFSRRFGDRKIPLLLALDPEAGVGYGSLEGGGRPALLRGLHFPQSKEKVQHLPWSAAHRLLLEKWNALAPEDKVIRLEEKELQELPLPPEAASPPGFAVLFRITAEGLLLESAGGVTGTSLVGRFTPFSQELFNFSRQLAQSEAGMNPGVLFAEIGQLSDSHADNINRRMPLFDYEIPINAVSLLPLERQILPSDLLVSLSGSEVILESRRLKKRVVPRLSSAYNFSHNHMALFRFLCDLQYQGLYGNLSFDLEQYFPHMSRYPRVVCGEAILSPAKWRLNEGIAGSLPPGLLREQYHLPRYVALTRFDQQLVFDLNDAGETRFFLDCVSGMKDILLQEFLLPAAEQSPVTAKSRGALVNQFIAFAHSHQAVYRPLPYSPPVAGRVQREFLPGSAWLYLKIHCAPRGADQLLVSRVLPALEELFSGQAGCWFFIRYSDPEDHIRLRLQISPAMTGAVLARFKAGLSGLVRDQVVREYQADTYRRELERYGAAYIGDIENCFCSSSGMVLRFLKNNRQGRFTTDQFAISSLAALLRLMIPDLPGRAHFLEGLFESFFREFGGDKIFRTELDSLYRSHKQVFAEAVDQAALYRSLQLEKYKRQFLDSLSRLAGRISGLEALRKRGLIADLIHMHLNRIYPAEQRQQEMVLYYFFLKYTRSQLAISRRPAGASFALDH